MKRQQNTPSPFDTTAFDHLSLAVEEADALTLYLGDRLLTAADEEEGSPDHRREYYALHLIAEDVSRKHRLILDNARALLEQGRAAVRSPRPSSPAGTTTQRKGASR